MLELLQPLDDRIVVWGQSCVGKTTFARLVPHNYLCFDSLFRWHEIEGLGLSCTANLQHIAGLIEAETQCVLDGWHLSDPTVSLIPGGVAVYIVYAPYAQIISQYRVPVDDFEEHRGMFWKWYEKDFPVFTRTVRFIRNTGKSFLETSWGEFQTFMLSEARSQ